MLEDASISGFSGGPVFELSQELHEGDEFIFVRGQRIVGLVHGTISEQGSGLTAIVPAKFIKETIEIAPGFNGKYIFKYDNGHIWSERIYRNGIPWTVEFNNKIDGSPQEKGTLKNGNGTLFIYNEKGTLIAIKYYRNGQLEKIESKGEKPH